MRRRWIVQAYYPRAVFGKLHPLGGDRIPDGLVSRHWTQRGALRARATIARDGGAMHMQIVDYRIERDEG